MTNPQGVHNMLRKKRQSGVFVLCLAGSLSLLAQAPNPTAQPQQPENGQGQPPSEMRDGVPVYKVQVVGRDIPAINYFHRKGSTKIAFQGTSLLPTARGTAKVDSQLGRTQINLDIRGLTPANGFGPEYLTYVLWAITPEGRPVNLGEVLPTGGKDKNTMSVTTNLQVFGLIITAEPYFAVTMPSDVVVMQNVVLNDKTQGVIEQVDAHYSLLPRGAYTETAGSHTVLHPITRNERSPLELYEADNAVQIAEAEGAGRYAVDTLQKAKVALRNAQDIDGHSRDRRQTITYAREAVQAAEDARIITVRRMRAADEAATKKAAADAQLAAQASAQAAQQQAEERARAQKAAEEAEARASAAKAAQQAAEQSAQQASQQAEQARERLKQQLSQVLQTKETARGLIMNMSDVLFDFNKYTLKPEAREKLAKVSGILLAYPGLTLQVEGYTDNIGSDEYNQKLSEQRADGVKDYLASQSVPDAEISAAGYGKSDPIADNSTSSGRAQNRRVQLVVSGAGIGVQEKAPGDQSMGQPGPVNKPSPNSGTSARQEIPSNPSGTSNPPQQ
jgi:outer membrane protein OmpA-like peptidoglycan-associated protein